MAAPEFDPTLLRLRADLLTALGGGSGTDAALRIVVQVHLARAVRGTVPLVVGLACLAWYGLQVRNESAAVFAAAGDLVVRWTAEPAARRVIEDAMGVLAGGVVGDEPDDPLDVHV